MRCRRPFAPRARRICLLLMDVDGVLTDGRISFIEGTAEAKTYDVKDGIGLSVARRMGLRTGVLSGRGEMWRQNDDSRFKKWASRGSSHMRSTGNTGFRATKTSIGPSPTTW